MTSKLTKEWLQHQISAIEAVGITDSNTLAAFKMALAAMDSEPHTGDELSNLLWYSQEATCHSDPNYYCEFQRLATPGLIAGIIRELQERRKADSEPVAFTEKHEISNMHATGLYLRAWPADRARNAVEGYTIPLYRHAPPTPERDQVRREHAEWSQATFGNVGPVGPLKHLSKEALEAAAEPGDLSEWADMQFLLWDAQRRAGITDEQITQAMIEKLAVNKLRDWPEPKDGEPRLHIKEQPAPVVPEEWTIADAVKFCKETGRQDAGAAMGAWNACRAAMRQELKKSAGTEAICRSDENVQVLHTKSPAQSDCCPAQNQGWIPVSEQMPEAEGHYLVWANASRIDGYCDHLAIATYQGGEWSNEFNWLVTHWMPLPAAPQKPKP